MKSYRCIVYTLLCIAVVFAFFMYVDQSSHWVYDPVMLQQIAKEGIAAANAKHEQAHNDGNKTTASSSEIVEEVIKKVLEVYPSTTQYTHHWLFNNAGGAMGSMTVLHCSLSEYLIIFGTRVGTEGHTGRFMAEDFFTILYGEQWAALPGVGDREVYTAGMQHYLPRHTAKQYKMPDECWALEYARGNIASMMFFGFADMLTSTLDYTTLLYTVRESAGNMFHNLWRYKI